MKNFYEDMFKVSKEFYKGKTETLMGEFFSELRGKTFIMSFKACEYQDGNCFESDISYFNASISLDNLTANVDCYESSYSSNQAIKCFEEEILEILEKSISLQLENKDSEINKYLQDLNIKPKLVVKNKNGNLQVHN